MNGLQTDFKTDALDTITWTVEYGYLGLKNRQTYPVYDSGGDVAPYRRIELKFDKFQWDNNCTKIRGYKVISKIKYLLRKDRNLFVSLINSFIFS